MTKLIAVTAFSWAHRGVEVEHFEKGQEFETDDPDLVEVSTSEGWASDDGKPVKNKDKTVSPENKAQTPSEVK